MALLAAAAVLTISAATAQQNGQRALVLQGGTLIDGTGKAPIPDAVIVVEGTRITAVGRRGQVQVPPNANVINLTGRTILPGLIDSHLHSQEWNPPMFLPYGVTTMVDQNVEPTWIFAQRDALRTGKMKGPRMFAAGYVMVGTFGFTSAFNNWNLRPVTTVEEARARARTKVAQGVDIMKVNQNITDEQLRAVIEVANAAGLQSVGHTRNIRQAASLGFKYSEHMFNIANALADPDLTRKPKQGGRAAKPGDISPEAGMDPKGFPALVAYMVSQGVYVNPTLTGQWSMFTPRGQEFADEAKQLIKDPGLAFVPAEVKESWTRVRKARLAGADKGWVHVKEFLRQYAKAGGKAVVGTDAGLETIPGLSEHREMQMLVDVGYSPMQAIQAATLWNAQMLKKDKDLGSVEPGKLADFAIIEGNPLTNISATKNIRMVIKDGKVMDTKYDPNWVNPIPQPYNVFQERPPMGVTRLSPAVVRQGGKTVTLQVEGVRFRPNAIVRFDNEDLPTRFISPTKLTATLDARFLQRGPGSYPLYVVTPGLHGTVSTAAYEVIDTASNPVSPPQSYGAYADARSPLYGPTPRSARQGGKTVTLEIEGERFTPAAIVRFDNEDLPTKFVSATKLTATLDAKFLQRHPGSYALYVVNPGPRGDVSDSAYFLVDLK